MGGEGAEGGGATDRENHGRRLLKRGATPPLNPTTSITTTSTVDNPAAVGASGGQPPCPHPPHPTSPSPAQLRYDNTALKTGNAYQVIGAHLNGIQLKGPAEANGFNVDTSLIPLPCGGHVTPPAGGAQYHYHKPANCQDIQTPNAHGPLIGYAADGFSMYGYGDLTGMPVLDECHGHFGAIDESGEVTYHYHTSDEYNMDTDPVHKPYYMGCQGPSISRCNETLSDDFDDGANWCGAGCGESGRWRVGWHPTDLHSPTQDTTCACSRAPRRARWRSTSRGWRAGLRGWSRSRSTRFRGRVRCGDREGNGGGQRQDNGRTTGESDADGGDRASGSARRETNSNLRRLMCT